MFKLLVFWGLIFIYFNLYSGNPLDFIITDEIYQKSFEIFPEDKDIFFKDKSDKELASQKKEFENRVDKIFGKVLISNQRSKGQKFSTVLLYYKDGKKERLVVSEKYDLKIDGYTYRILSSENEIIIIDLKSGLQTQKKVGD